MSNSPRKIAVITGASSGIGAVYADRLARRGYDLVLVARRADRLQALAAELAALHAVAVQWHVADLGTDDGLGSVEELLATEDRVSVLVNNAGIARLAPVSASPLGDSMSQIALNITALTRLSHAVLPGMTARKEGTIINISSVMALNTLPISSVYSGSKAYVLAFSRGLQEELADTGVRVQVVLPAATATEVWDNSGVPLSALPPEAVMRTDAMVDAALTGLDQGEHMTMPSVADVEMINNFESSRVALFATAQTGTVAPRLL